MTNQQELELKTGIAQGDISVYLRDIEKGDLFRKPILKILKAQGKGDVIRKFIKEVQG